MKNRHQKVLLFLLALFLFLFMKFNTFACDNAPAMRLYLTSIHEVERQMVGSDPQSLKLQTLKRDRLISIMGKLSKIQCK